MTVQGASPIASISELHTSSRARMAQEATCTQPRPKNLAALGPDPKGTLQEIDSRQSPGQLQFPEHVWLHVEGRSCFRPSSDIAARRRSRCFHRLHHQELLSMMR